MIEREIERDTHQTNNFLVDYIPNHKYMLKIDTLLKDVDATLSRFEEKVSSVQMIPYLACLVLCCVIKLTSELISRALQHA